MDGLFCGECYLIFKHALGSERTLSWEVLIIKLNRGLRESNRSEPKCLDVEIIATECSKKEMGRKVKNGFWKEILLLMEHCLHEEGTLLSRQHEQMF